MGESDIPRLVKADFHNWLATSDRFSKYFSHKVLDHASKSLGRGGVLGVVEASDENRYTKFKGLLEHSPIDYGNALYCWDQDITLIRGERVYTKDSGSLLVLGLEEKDKIAHERTIQDTFEEAVDKKGVIIFNPSYCDLPNESYLEYVDAIEVHNGGLALKSHANTDAQEFYENAREQHDLGSIVTSGGHSIREIGSSWMKMPELNRTSGESIRESIREGIKNWRYPNLGEERRASSYVAPIMHAAKLHTPVIGWVTRSKKRTKTDSIA